jgi:hypothetical protein
MLDIKIFLKFQYNKFIRIIINLSDFLLLILMRNLCYCLVFSTFLISLIVQTLQLFDV